MMIKNITMLSASCVLLMACEQTTQPLPTPTMSEAEAIEFCRALEVEASRPKTTLDLGVGVSGGKVRPRGGISIGLDVTGAEGKQLRFERCVVEKSGEVTNTKL